MKIFLQTDFQKDWAKDKEMTGIFHLFSFFLKKHETRPLCELRTFNLCGGNWTEKRPFVKNSEIPGKAGWQPLVFFCKLQMMKYSLDLSCFFTAISF